MKTYRNLMFLFAFVCFASCERNDPSNIDPPYSYLDEPGFITEGLVGYYPFNGDTRDYSGNDNHATGTGLAYATDRFDHPAGALRFNGTDDYLVIPDFAKLINGQEATLLFWCRVDTPTKGQANPAILAMVDSVNTCFLIHSEMGRLRYALGNYPKLGGASVNTSVDREGYKWVAFSFVYKCITLYDCSPETYTESSVHNTAYSFGFDAQRKGQSLWLGKSPINTFVSGIFDNFFTSFRGEIDDLIIYNRVLTEQEIRQLAAMTAPMKP